MLGWGSLELVSGDTGHEVGRPLEGMPGHYRVHKHNQIVKAMLTDKFTLDCRRKAYVNTERTPHRTAGVRRGDPLLIKWDQQVPFIFFQAKVGFRNADHNVIKGF